VSAEVFGLNNLFAALLMSQAVDIDLVDPEQYHQVPKVSVCLSCSWPWNITFGFILLNTRCLIECIFERA